MHKYSLDNSVLLGNLCNFHEPFVRIAAVLADYGLHPVAFVVNVLLVVVLVPKFDFGTGYGHVDYTYPVLLRQVFYHLASEEVHRTHIVALAADRRDGGVPMSLLPSELGHIHRRHELEARIVEILVLFRRRGSGFHIGLPNAEVYEKVRVRRILCGGNLASCGQYTCCSKKFYNSFHLYGYLNVTLYTIASSQGMDDGQVMVSLSFS